MEIIPLSRNGSAIITASPLEFILTLALLTSPEYSDKLDQFLSLSLVAYESLLPYELIKLITALLFSEFFDEATEVNT